MDILLLVEQVKSKAIFIAEDVSSRSDRRSFELQGSSTSTDETVVAAWYQLPIPLSCPHKA